MRRTLFRAGLACLVLYGSVAMGAFALSAQESNSGAKSDARPQLACAPLEQLREQLASKYGETLTAVGILNPKVAINVYTSERGTFTVVLVTTKGTACIQSVGKNFSLRSKPVAGSDA